MQSEQTELDMQQLLDKATPTFLWTNPWLCLTVSVLIWIMKVASTSPLLILTLNDTGTGTSSKNKHPLTFLSKRDKQRTALIQNSIHWVKQGHVLFSCKRLSRETASLLLLRFRCFFLSSMFLRNAFACLRDNVVGEMWLLCLDTLSFFCLKTFFQERSHRLLMSKYMSDFLVVQLILTVESLRSFVTVCIFLARSCLITYALSSMWHVWSQWCLLSSWGRSFARWYEVLGEWWQWWDCF